MKHVQIIIILVFIYQFGFAQSPKEISENDLKKCHLEIEKEVVKLRKELNAEEYLSDFDKQITVDFKIDTLRIEKLLSKKIEIDYSTSGMVNASYEAEIEYDKLLNKYYQILAKKLDPADKEILKQSQKNWIAFRDSERKFNSAISKDQYSGGGTMQRIIVASGYLEITRKRLFEIVDYLNKLSE
ncbi:lysozyme inhibitor LprI family protein [Flavobacterium sp. Fl-77]|uniref:Lysozyme inhibitor LprI family protein n=1 Tax=Flavobacterium flavipigmentatum TaxID=2893884 RepID=A0AAJ2SAE1_9FLAO|nr:MULTISPECIES: lysozyme inhibitor LprI family protein [unclassified Flavobacterium]MDX6180532.1 lysozyme inhibitor LprI family protein [Flavobacterium sp. Fl-33]MDX6184132.1 lysozyme inhibitor LprI family protein [Flavobacterium sp. Fl-77]UFH39247.1 lysozyme inhibitor LprI family protein [Flavobacterium sp. F-70]